MRWRTFLSRRQQEPKQGNTDERQHNCNNTSRLVPGRGQGPVPAAVQRPAVRAQTVHRAHFDPNRVQVSTLLSIKTGACPEDCKYCPQSGHYNTGLEKQKLMEVQKVLEEAARAKAIGSTRFCMGAAWKHPSAKDMPYVRRWSKASRPWGWKPA